MKILLVNETGQTMARLDDVEKYDGSQPAHIARMLDLLETLIASAKLADQRATPGRAAAGAAWEFF